jgi:hypothetical protein
MVDHEQGPAVGVLALIELVRQQQPVPAVDVLQMLKLRAVSWGQRTSDRTPVGVAVEHVLLTVEAVDERAHTGRLELYLSGAEGDDRGHP